MTAPNMNWQQLPDSSYWRATYSKKAREKAGETARDDYDRYMRAIRQAEQVPSWAKPLMDKQDKTAEKYFEVGKILLDGAQTYWGVGEDKYKAAYNEPWTMGIRPDLACPAEADGCLAKKDGGGVDTVPSPEGPGSNDYEGPNGTGDSNDDEVDPKEKNEWPEGMNEDSELTDPIISDDEDVNIDLSDDLDATPVLRDERTKTALQICQEKEEKKLWDEIGSTTLVPNAEGNSAQSQEDQKAQAEHYKRLGFCDRSYYGDASCREWKRQMDSVPLTPDMKAELELTQQGRLDLCPVNLIKVTECQLARQRIYMRFAILDPMTELIDSKFKPGGAVDVVPRLDFMIPGNNITGLTPGFQVLPLTETPRLVVDDEQPLKPLVIPRLPGVPVPKPWKQPGGETPRLPIGFNSFHPTLPKDGSDILQLLPWGSPSTTSPDTRPINRRTQAHRPAFDIPAIGGHTVRRSV
ncbi:MAG: hypothetical protein L6R40_008627 [Gallowayella cf. fulva]|nr:MAG: hypothetical protein L6R40_008627 [Xanthomendoza cf. fulva]